MAMIRGDFDALDGTTMREYECYTVFVPTGKRPICIQLYHDVPCDEEKGYFSNEESCEDDIYLYRRYLELE